MGNTPSDDVVVQSVDRALAVLDVCARDGWVGVTSVAAELGVHKSTAFRLLATLQRRGLVEQHAGTQKYRLGFGLVRLAGAVRAELDLPRLSRPACEGLSAATGETVTLAVLEAGEVVYVDQVSVAPSVVGVNWLGRRAALHTTSDGKVFLAHLPARVRDEFLEAELPVATTRNGTADLRDQLAQIRTNGYGLALEELEPGLHAVAAPVRGAAGPVLATIGVSGPSYRLPPERMADLGRLTADAADRVSRRLGFHARRGA